MTNLQQPAAFRLARVSAAIVCLLPVATGWTSEQTKASDTQSIAAVEAGRITTAIASWWGFDPEDATRCLQAALDSRAREVVVPDMGRPWIVTTIRLPGDKRIVFQPAVVVEAKRGALLGPSDCLFVARDKKHLQLHGERAIFRMHKEDYHRPPYRLAEWRHALSIRGCEDVTVRGLTLQHSGGDGIYLGIGSDGATNRNVTIRDVVCDGNNRQGISVITAENLLIENCVFRDTRGTAPQAGIDFEPNRPEERLVNCVLRNCRSENNAGHAYHFYLGNLHQASPPVSIRLENCTSRDCERYSAYVGVANRSGQRTVRGTIEFVDCRFDGDRGAGVYIRGNEADGCLVRLQGCEIIRRDPVQQRLSPLTIEAPRQPDIDVGNIEIDRCTIRDAVDRQPIALAASPLTRVRNLGGSLTYTSPSGRQAVTLDAGQLAQWFPLQKQTERIERFSFDWRKAVPLATAGGPEEPTASLRVRGRAMMLAWAAAEQPVRLAARVEAVSRRGTGPGVMTITAGDGTVTRLQPVADGDELCYTFTPQAAGPLRLEWQGDSKCTQCIVRCSAPLNYLATSPGLHLFRSVGRLYFAVPAGVDRWAVQVTGAGTAETVRGTVRNAADQVVAAQNNIALPHVFLLQRKKTDADEIWSLTLERADEGVLEDVTLDTLGIPPLFATVPGAVMTCRESE